jgi:hypothetical protein
MSALAPNLIQSNSNIMPHGTYYVMTKRLKSWGSCAVLVLFVIKTKFFNRTRILAVVPSTKTFAPVSGTTGSSTVLHLNHKVVLEYCTPKGYWYSV